MKANMKYAKFQSVQKKGESKHLVLDGENNLKSVWSDNIKLQSPKTLWSLWCPCP